MTYPTAAFLFDTEFYKLHSLYISSILAKASQWEIKAGTEGRITITVHKFLLIHSNSSEFFYTNVLTGYAFPQQNLLLHNTHLKQILAFFSLYLRQHLLNWVKLYKISTVRGLKATEVKDITTALQTLLCRFPKLKLYFILSVAFSLV